LWKRMDKRKKIENPLMLKKTSMSARNGTETSAVPLATGQSTINGEKKAGKVKNRVHGPQVEVFTSGRSRKGAQFGTRDERKWGQEELWVSVISGQNTVETPVETKIEFQDIHERFKKKEIVHGTVEHGNQTMG